MNTKHSEANILATANTLKVADAANANPDAEIVTSTSMRTNSKNEAASTRKPAVHKIARDLAYTDIRISEMISDDILTQSVLLIAPWNIFYHAFRNVF